MTEENEIGLIEVPISELSERALRGVLEAFVLREGTDYGTREFSLQDKIEHVRRQIEAGNASLVFDPRSNSVDILTPRELKRRTSIETG